MFAISIVNTYNKHNGSVTASHGTSVERSHAATLVYDHEYHQTAACYSLPTSSGEANLSTRVRPYMREGCITGLHTFFWYIYILMAVLLVGQNAFRYFTITKCFGVLVVGMMVILVFGSKVLRDSWFVVAGGLDLHAGILNCTWVSSTPSYL